MHINQKQLEKVLSIQTVSRDDTAMLTYIKQYVSGALKLRYSEDKYGNIYVTKGTCNYVGIVSHTDTVHAIAYEYGLLNYKDEVYIGYGKKSKESPCTTLGCGGDDKVGVYICLQALKDLPDVKCVFYRDEEIGRNGSKASDIDYLKDCSFIIQCDRRNNNDFITNSGGIKMTSHDFDKDSKEIYTKYGYKDTIGTCTDVDVLVKQGVNTSCINLSCGYYLPHTDDTYVVIKDVDTCYQLVKELYNKLRYKKYSHKYTQPVYTYDYSTYDDTSSSQCTEKVRVYEQFTLIEIDNEMKLYNCVKDDFDFASVYDIKSNSFEILKPNHNFSLCQKKSTRVWIADPKLLKNLNKQFKISSSAEITHDDIAYGYTEYVTTNYVYSRLHGAWLSEADAKWNESLGTYELM